MSSFYLFAVRTPRCMLFLFAYKHTQLQFDFMKPHFLIKLNLALIVCFVLFFGLSGCSRQQQSISGQRVLTDEGDSLERMLKSGVMRVGYIQYPPAAIKDPRTGEVSGDFVEIARFIANELKLKLEFHEVTWSNFATALQTQQYDISISCTYIKVGRASNLAFSRPIAYLGNSAVVRKNDTRFSQVSTPLDFDRKGIVVAVVQGESSHEFVQEHFKNATVRVLSGSDLSAPLSLVAVGQADVGLSDAYVTATYCNLNADLINVFADHPYDVSPMAWAVRQEDVRLLNFINNSLDYLENSGKLAEWHKKYNAHWLTKEIKWKAE